MSLPSYPEYKDSGLEWFAEIPKHWCVSRLSRLAEVIDPQPDHRAPPIVQGDGYPYVGIRDLNADGTVNFDTARQVAEDAVLKQESAFVIRKGDIVFCKVGTLGFPRQIRPHGRLALSATLVLIKPRSDVSSRFLLYSLDAIGIYAQIGYFSTGSTRAALGIEQIRRFVLPAPPLDEQLTLASFLDRETGKIDTLIAEQEKLLALLAEKRQATISHAVTKGLNPDAPMKDSGVEWLGEVPEHWDVCRVKDVAKLESGHTPSKQFPEYWENCDIPWVSLNDSKFLATNDYISDTAFKINELGLANSSARLLPADSVLFTRDATIGLAAITTQPMAVSQHLIAWCPTGVIAPKYLLRVFNAMKSHLDSYTFGATIKTIGMGDVKTLVTPAPPPQEQASIVEYLDAKLTTIDSLTFEATRTVELLKERRSALIAAAVTGQIDVRCLVTELEVA